MPEKISDDEFKTNVTRFIEVANQKFDGLTADVRTNSIRLDKLDQRIEHLAFDHGNKFDAIAKMLRDLSTEVKTLASQFNQVGAMAIKDNGRITELEKRVDVLE